MNNKIEKVKQDQWNSLKNRYSTAGNKGYSEEEFVSRKLQQEFQAMLMRLCLLLNIPDIDHNEIVTQGAMTLNDIPIVFKLEGWSGFVKIYIDIGRPLIVGEKAAYQYLLEQQLLIPAPFSLVSGLHPESKHIILYGCAPLSTDENSDADFLLFLQSCLQVVTTLKMQIGNFM